MVLEYDENILKEKDIIKAVEGAGYGASLSNKIRESSRSNEKKTDNNSIINSMKKRLIYSICFLIPLMYVAMHQMFNNLFCLPIPSFINNWFGGVENAISFGVTQFLLLLPILYLNRNYFIIGFKRLFKGSPNMDSLIALR